MKSSEQLRQNWVHWQHVEPAVRAYVRRHWFRQWEAEDVLAQGMELFVQRYRGQYELPRKIHFAKMCMKCAARGLGYWERKDIRRREYVPLSELDQIPTDELITSDSAHRLEQVDRLLSNGGCSQIKTAIKLMVAGHSQKFAAQAVGWTAPKLSRALAEMGQIITGRKPVRNRRRIISPCDNYDLFASLAA